MKNSLICMAMAALWRKLGTRRSLQGNRPLSKLDEHLLDDLGLTREQADELDKRHEHQARSSEKPD
ncbi:DUF1127 domain-containing protein (plasmid) [Agrobacterium salinitolerans]|uniref:DUF1127 domain-containing protein n=1 Tax=Agrobacterium salinitolerans TaxID=1183413 RepID=UPI001C233EA0|nr:DUF1127 domain-containing protein [Agrobacterium salinitolerans]QXC52857.1 DUF1127 domain-containing protein [Agrobacterium salinitolerans]